jgi:hypothetical protein
VLVSYTARGGFVVNAPFSRAAISGFTKKSGARARKLTT